ncbi:MAG: TusE/DsrC/DsvC family sulfur relay protein [Gammaproteobacteria bacterium]|nr:TusE/DsrC/DsvC family sulfur relay protein [Gammaproteobacteria bacterium]
MIEQDKEGYLKNLDDWSEMVAGQIALDDGIALTPAHWEILRLLRRYYNRYQATPASRALISYVKKELGPEKGKSIYLMQLFGGSAARSAAKIAGLPKPDNCL